MLISKQKSIFNLSYVFDKEYHKPLENYRKAEEE
jgi:hypothetical protein